MISIAIAWFLINWHWLYVILGIIAVLLLLFGTSFWDGFILAEILDSLFP